MNLTGTLNNTAATLNLDTATGTLNLVGGTIANGTIMATAAQVTATSSGGTLSGVTLDANLNLTAQRGRDGDQRADAERHGHHRGQ